MSLLRGAPLEVILNAFDAVAVAGRLLRDERAADAVLLDQIAGDVPELSGKVLMNKQDVHRISGQVAAARAKEIGNGKMPIVNLQLAFCNLESFRTMNQEFFGLPANADVRFILRGTACGLRKGRAVGALLSLRPFHIGTTRALAFAT